MPAKKNQPNAFFFFMQSLKPQLQRQGVVLENGNRTLAELAGPRWAELSEDEKEPFVELAKQSKNNKRYGGYSGADNKMDCTRQLISKRVDTVALNEQRRRKERKQVVESWTGKDVCDEHFFMIGFMSLCNLPDDQYMPCEVAVAEFSLRHGIHRHFHKFIDPGTIRMGFRYEAMKQSEATHQIPPEGLSTDTYQDIYEELEKFINPRRLALSPPLYCKSSETKLVEFSLQWMSLRAGITNKMKRVYELEGLVCDLHAESMDAEVKMAPSKHHATQLLSTTVFDYEAGSRCKWHEDKEIRYCAMGTVTRYCYCLSDFLCGAFRIEMTSSHLPERPDGDSCTVITPRISDGNDRVAVSASRKKTDSRVKQNTAGGGYRNNSSESGGRKKQYTRRGPTYDEESLKSSAVTSESSTAEVPSTVPTQLSSFARGRGRGRATPILPLRRPNLLGFVAHAEEEPVPTLPVSNASSSKTVPKSPWSGQLGAGRGRGVRPPNTTPKVWAGGASAPHPSTAPLPPTSWQHESGFLPSSTSVSYPWATQPPNDNLNPNVPTWASLDTPNLQSLKLGNYTDRSALNTQHLAGGKENINFQQGLQDFSLFDKDSYDY